MRMRLNRQPDLALFLSDLDLDRLLPDTAPLFTRQRQRTIAIRRRLRKFAHLTQRPGAIPIALRGARRDPVADRPEPDQPTVGRADLVFFPHYSFSYSDR